MKILDETGTVMENPDLTLGYLTDDTEEVTHPAVEGVEEQWHWETVTEYPNGGPRRKKRAKRPKPWRSCRTRWWHCGLLWQTRTH